MPTRLVKQATTYFTPVEFADYINREGGYDYSDFGAAFAALGLTVVSTFCGHYISEKAAFAINALSIGLTVQTLIGMIFENDDVRKRNEICQKMVRDGGRAKVITSVYEYSK
ncbi:hypothetical protein SAMN05660826_02333 [Caldanaerovirga acetigignens]|uniref:Uncharacterized protein n=1 Tax=Caldanaerovirga acetigignens TaxID=447595 RepID=A0A1M7ML68_9FIRM|nr:hypothetical protein [Caldanaerovirga acetigignens]SHM91647.1 hypothetical protein SAMN05660826_02333 [Caldanaerovirga acetigignens]